MLANTITIARILLTFGVIILFGTHRTLNIILVSTIALIFLLDALDGSIARRRNETSQIGALLDTLADRIIENTFWIYFTLIGVIPLWMPIVVLTRGFITDALQPYKSSPKNRWADILTRSRISSGLYGTLKMLAFICLASHPFLKNKGWADIGFILATLAVSVCLIRALPTFMGTYKTIAKPTFQKTPPVSAKHVEAQIPQKTIGSRALSNNPNPFGNKK